MREKPSHVTLVKLIGLTLLAGVICTIASAAIAVVATPQVRASHHSVQQWDIHYCKSRSVAIGVAGLRAPGLRRWQAVDISMDLFGLTSGTRHEVYPDVTDFIEMAARNEPVPAIRAVSCSEHPALSSDDLHAPSWMPLHLPPEIVLAAGDLPQAVGFAAGFPLPAFAGSISRPQGDPPGSFATRGLWTITHNQTMYRFPWRPHWPGFLVNTLFYTVAILAVSGAHRTFRSHLRVRRGRCGACGYDLTATSQDRWCPECGCQRAGRKSARGCIIQTSALKG